MARTQTMVQLRDDLVAVLDAEATRRGISRSALIREALEAYIDDALRADVGRRIVEGYQRIPQEVPDEWGDLAVAVDHATRETMERLTAEERARGHEPW